MPRNASSVPPPPRRYQSHPVGQRPHGGDHTPEMSTPQVAGSVAALSALVAASAASGALLGVPVLGMLLGLIVVALIVLAALMI